MKFLKYLIALMILITFTNIANAAKLTVESESQVYDDSKKLIILDKEVNVNIDDVNVRSPKAFLNITGDGKPDTATFVDGARAIQVTKNSKSEVKANILKLSLITKDVEAVGSAETMMEQLGKPTITIKSDYQTYNTDTNLMQAKDNVILTYGDVRATSNLAKIWVSQKKGFEFLKLIGNAKIIQEKITVTGSEIDLDGKTEIMNAVGSTFTNVTVDETTNVKIWATNQQYNNKTNTAIASGNVKINYSTYVATGPKAVMLANPKTNQPNKVIFSGRSKIVDGDKSIEADNITITMNPKNFTAVGHVKTTITNLDDVNNGK